jgi:hypothetical protein
MMTPDQLRWTHFYNQRGFEMLQISTTKFGKFRCVDIESLPRIGKSKPHEMRQEDLYAALKKMGCTRIDVAQGRQDLLPHYGVWLQEREEAAETS